MATYKVLIEHVLKFQKDKLLKEETENVIVGGKADKQTIEDVAKYWSKKDKTLYEKCLEILKKELELGLKIEAEHTDDKEERKEIALDHLKEDKKYYSSKKPKDWAKKELEKEKKEK